MTVLGAAAAAALLATAGAFVLLPGDAALVAGTSAAALLALVARGVFSVRSSVAQPTAWRSDDAGETRVALTFDDGPHPRWTQGVLDVLRRRGVRATFFVVGENARRHPALLRRMRDEGHEIGCHGDTHAWTTPFFGRARFDGEVTRCLDAVRSATGLTPRLYRAPVGLRSPLHGAVLARRDLRVVGMARRGRDARAGRDPGEFARRFAGAARGGEVLALHDGEEPAHPVPRDGTVDALPAILDGLERRGLRPVPVSALLAERPYRETPERGWTGRSRGGRAGLWFFRTAARVLGARGCRAFVPLVTAWYVVVHREARRASVALRRRLHGRADAVSESLWAWRHFATFGRTMVDRMAFLHGGAPPPPIEVDGAEALRAAADERGGGAGFLLVSAHVGDWIAASRVRHFGGRPLWVVAAQGMGPGPHQVRRDAGADVFRTIDADAPPIEVASGIAAALRGGGVVAMLGDRAVSSDVLRLPFLGGEASFPAGPWRVARAMGAPVLVFFTVRLPDGRHRLEFRGPIRVGAAGGRAASRDDDVRTAASAYVAHLEDVVRRHPHHWSNFYDFWRAR